MKVQVSKEAYDFSKYVGKFRWMSYYYQITETLKTDNNNILVIGIGDGIVIDVLRKMGKNVTTFDFDVNLNPDILGSVTDLDKCLKKQKFDCIVCCQVLEHIPFEKFENIIELFKQYVNKKIILSLPLFDFSFTINVGCSFLGERHIRFPIRRFWKRKFRIEKEGFNEHYWEVNAPGYNQKKIIMILKKYFTISKKYIPVENTYHMFFILEPKDVK